MAATISITSVMHILRSTFFRPAQRRGKGTEAFADLDGNFDSFTQGASAVTNGSSNSSMNQQLTSSALTFPTLSTTAPLPVPDLLSEAANNISNIPVSMQMQMPFHQSQLELVLSNPASNHSNHMTSASSSSSPQSDGSPPSGVLVSRKRSRAAAKLDNDEDEAAAVRRQKNTLAARKYRQKRLDRIKELEDALAEVTGERDDLRIRLARQEAETQALKALMAQLGPRVGDKKE
ncbi:hypothetical protein TD95_004332 [Thielaviopsis punctulata]|uniref:BZIP domain-containing protein n=1 Tax=Thielaviopsis punctulata TaxID=72032 RepID=A0A0F4ZJY9_9PEZI|nr:hypothetical protein TD95_004332 [Thielaviopsis punctulata]